MLTLLGARSHALLTLWFALIGNVVRADSWEKPKRTDYLASNGNYVFRVTPDGGWPNRNGWCLGELSRLEGGKEAVVWKRYLVNNHAPVQAIVSDSGLYVVTLDEWGHVGTLPVVVYGPRGELIRVHNLESLLGATDVPGRVTVSSVWWNEDALVFFGPKDATLFVRLSTGRLIMISMKSGSLMDDKWFRLESAIGASDENTRASLHAVSKEGAADLALRYLQSDNPRQRRTGAVVAGQLGLRDTIPRLRALLKDETESLSIIGLLPVRHRYVADAAKEALIQMGEKPQ